MPQRSSAFLFRLFGLEGDTAVVVGGAGRIGRALCRALAEAGARVCVLDVDRAPAERLAQRIAQETGRAALSCAADASDADQLREALERVRRALGPPRILVNSAQYRGAGFYSSKVEEYPRPAWNAVIEANLTAVHAACQVFGGAMAEQEGGRIVNLGSTYGVVSPDPRIYGDSGVNSPVAYAASKAGVIGLTRYLAVHWRDKNVRVNCLVPGGVFDGQAESFVAHYCQRTPLGRMATPEDYQGAVLFMASRASDYMTGAVVTVDGGWTAW